jgi:hypothetical protein
MDHLGHEGDAWRAEEDRERAKKRGVTEKNAVFWPLSRAARAPNSSVVVDIG